MSAGETPEGTPEAPEADPRVNALRERLNQAFIEVNHGEYFRSRIHGWVAYLGDADVRLPDGIAKRLTSPFAFERDDDAADIATLDAFVIAHHAAESYWRYLLALVDGSGPTGAPLIAMTELKAGQAFNDRVTGVVDLPDPQLTQLLDFLFLPPEFKEGWQTDAPSIGDVQTYLRLWCRALGHFVSEWRNAYNSAKHGLALGARPVQFTFIGTEDSPGTSVDLMNGPVLRTVEHELVCDDDGRAVKDAGGQRLVRWYWMYRAVDPEELIAQGIVTADLLDWLRAIARARLLRQVGTPVHVRSEPKPLDIRRRTSPGLSFRMNLAALPLPPDEAAAVLSRLEEED